MQTAEIGKVGGKLAHARVHLFGPLFQVVAVGAVATLCMLAVRFYIVEPESLASACAAGAADWRCSLRALVVYGFVNNVFGLASFIAGVLATIARWRWLAVIAMCAGVAGAVLYRFELAGVGLLLGALVLARPRLPAAQQA